MLPLAFIFPTTLNNGVVIVQAPGIVPVNEAAETEADPVAVMLASPPAVTFTLPVAFIEVSPLLII